MYEFMAAEKVGKEEAKTKCCPVWSLPSRTNEKLYSVVFPCDVGECFYWMDKDEEFGICIKLQKQEDHS